MAPFEFVRPRSLQEAISLLDPDDSDIRPMGGGTALTLMMKAGVLRPTRIVDLSGVEPEYAQVSVDRDGQLRIGGMTRLSNLEHAASVVQHWPLLARTLRGIANPRVRHVATIGGNLAHADPHMDLPPVLSALHARVRVRGRSGERELAVEDLCTGYYETALARDELICEVIVPPQAGRPATYQKVTTRASHDWPALGLAVVLEMQGRQLAKASIVLGAATDRPTRLVAAEALLVGSTLDDADLQRAGDAAAAQIEIVADQHGSASYKKQLLRVHLGRSIRQALQSAPSLGEAA